MADSGESNELNTNKSNPEISKGGVKEKKSNENQDSAEKNQLEEKKLEDSGIEILQEDHAEAEKDEKPKPKNQKMHELVFSDESIERYKKVATIIPAPEKAPVTIMFARGYLNPALEFLADTNVFPAGQEKDRKIPKDSGIKILQEDHAEAKKEEKPKPKNLEMHELVFSDESIERYKQVATIIPAPEKAPITIMFARGYLNPALEFLADTNVFPAGQEKDRKIPRLTLIDAKSRVATKLRLAQESDNKKNNSKNNK
ncbi:uncharacterized protein [Drosophila bipectinata]|uniref:uncharacterized protein n=1 Tax=Drosophila bipectinata TaxID=42026 RepID=UPI0038B2E1DB